MGGGKGRGMCVWGEVVEREGVGGGWCVCVQGLEEGETARQTRRKTARNVERLKLVIIKMN